MQELLRELGKVEGREEEREKIARRMAEQGFSKEQIEAITGLSAEEIEKLS